MAGVRPSGPWRGITAAVAAVLWVVIPDPPRAQAPEGTKPRLRDVLRIRALWWMMPLLFVNYAPAAGLRGLWAGPYLTDLYDANANVVGQVTLVMAFAMIAGNFAYGPLDRLLGTRKWVILGGNLSGRLRAWHIWRFPPLWGFLGKCRLLAAVGFLWGVFPYAYGAWPQLHPAASDRAGGHAYQPVFHWWCRAFAGRQWPCSPAG